MADQKLEAMSGRIYRVAPKGHKLTRPQLDLNSAAGAVKALQSPNVATRYLAWQKLQSLAENEAILEPIWKGGDAYQKARAWHLLVRSDEQKYLDLAMADEDPEIRSLALRYVRAEKKDAIPVVKRLVNDPSPSVRRECALALHRSASADAPELWAELARQYPEGDRWYLEALGIGAYGQYDPFFSAWLKKAGDQWNTPGGRDIVWRMRSSKVPGLIVKILQDKNSQDSKDRYFRALDFIKGPERDAALVQLLTE